MLSWLRVTDLRFCDAGGRLPVDRRRASRRPPRNAEAHPPRRQHRLVRPRRENGAPARRLGPCDAQQRLARAKRGVASRTTTHTIDRSCHDPSRSAARDPSSARPPGPQAAVECIEACVSCAQSCTACADADLAEDDVTEMRRCIRLCLDCADVCEATGRVLTRQTEFDAPTAKAQLQSCEAMCHACARGVPSPRSAPRALPNL